MSQRNSGPDSEMERRHDKVAALLNNAAEYTIDQEIPANLVDRALSRSEIHCQASKWRRNLLFSLAGTAAVALLIAGVLLPMRRAPHTWTPRIATKAGSAPGALQVAQTRKPLQRPLMDRNSIRSNISSSIAQESGNKADKEFTPILPRGSHTLLHPKRATVRAHKIASEAIWKDEIVLSREQGILIPILPDESESDGSELQPGVAVIPVRSGATTCASPSEASH